MDTNGYNPSILDTEAGRCYLCGREIETIRHEVFYGTASRRLSKRYGLWVNICPICHEIVHRDKKGKPAQKLAQNAKKAFLKTHTEQEFIRIFVKGDIKPWEI